MVRQHWLECPRPAHTFHHVARSTVYVLPPPDAVADPPTLSLDAFSVGHAQLTDTTADHPALHWEANYKQEAFQSAHVVWSNHRAKDCFDRQTDMNLLMVVSGASDPQGNETIQQSE